MLEPHNLYLFTEKLLFSFMLTAVFITYTL
jgi:hypothetical protein